MSYIYTVKPIKEAIKIAVEHDDFTVNEAGKAYVYGIDVVYWPAGVKIKKAERVERGHIRIEENGYALPVRYFTETEEAPAVPEFIKGLYNAMTEPCGGVPCEKCPLDLMSDCMIFIKFIRDKWGIGK